MKIPSAANARMIIELVPDKSDELYQIFTVKKSGMSTSPFFNICLGRARITMSRMLGIRAAFIVTSCFADM